MPETVSTSVHVASLEGARKLKTRLMRAGFARNSINISQVNGKYEVSISTREENIRHAKRLLNHSPLRSDLILAREQIEHSVRRNTPAALGFAILTGAVFFHLTKRVKS